MSHTTIDDEVQFERKLACMTQESKQSFLCVGRFLALRFGLHFSNFVLPRFPGSRKTAQTQEESTDMYKGTVGSHLPSGVCVCGKRVQSE